MKRRVLDKDDFSSSRRVADKLRARRIKKGKTAKFIASVMGISAGYLCDLEAGKRCLSAALVTAYERALAK